MDKHRDVLIKIISAAYLFVFLAICVSIGFSKDFLMLFNGLFSVIYLISLWNTGTYTFNLYDNKFFTIDLLSVAIYANIPRLYFSGVVQEHFFYLYWILFALNEMLCLIWDYICHNISSDQQAKRFHMIWTLLTFVGIFIIVISILLVYTGVLANYILLADVFIIVYQSCLLLIWWISKYNIEKKHQVVSIQ